MQVKSADKNMITNQTPFMPKGVLKKINGTVLLPTSNGLSLILCPANMVADVKSNPLLDKLDTKWKKVKASQKGWYSNKTGAYKLGAIETLLVQSDAWVVHVLCQDEKLNLDENGLADGLRKVALLAKQEGASVHLSSEFLALSKNIPSLIESVFRANGINVFLYD